MGSCCTGERVDQRPNSIIEEANKSTSTHLSLESQNSNDKNSRRGTKTGVMTQIAMSFPKIRRSFRGCLKVFNKYAGEKGFVEKSEIREILIELGANESKLSEEEINRIISQSNLDGDDKIDFKEFLIAAAIGVFLNNNNNDNTSMIFLQIRDGFEVVQDAFNKIDKDGSGQIDYSELRNAFLSMRQDDLIEERLKELDFNGDKSIEFPEFIFGMCSWVGMDDHYEEDETIENLEVLSPQANKPELDTPKEETFQNESKENNNESNNYSNNNTNESNNEINEINEIEMNETEINESNNNNNESYNNETNEINESNNYTNDTNETDEVDEVVEEQVVVVEEEEEERTEEPSEEPGQQPGEDEYVSDEPQPGSE